MKLLIQERNLRSLQPPSITTQAKLSRATSNHFGSRPGKRPMSIFSVDAQPRVTQARRPSGHGLLPTAMVIRAQRTQRKTCTPARTWWPEAQSSSSSVTKKTSQRIIMAKESALKQVDQLDDEGPVASHPAGVI